MSWKRLSSPVRTVLCAVALLALVAGCGSGSTTTVTQFTFEALGPNGGVVAAGPVKLTVPPGALTQDTSVAILPQGTPLPIAPPPFDPCTYTLLTIYCIGPVGHGLLVNGVLRMGYDESLIPAGFTENDLVLLEWDNVGGVLVVRPMPPVTQDTVQNFFEDASYTSLGHVAIALRDCTRRNNNLLVQNGGAVIGQKPAQGMTAPVPALWLVDSLNVAPQSQVPTSALLFDGFVPSPDQKRVLLNVQNLDFSQELDTVRVDGVGPAILITRDDHPNQVFLQGYDNFYGWLAQGTGQYVYYFDYILPVMGTAVVTPPQRYELRARPGDASAADVLMHVTDASFSFPDDVRQSGTGARFLDSNASFTMQPNYVDLVNIPAGTTASSGLVPYGEGSSAQSARFRAGNDDVNVVTSMAQVVQRYTAAGAFVGTVWTLASANRQDALQIDDFALAPDDEHFAAVVDVSGEGTQSELWMGTLTDGVLATWSFFQQVSVNEMIWHPQQTGVFLDLSGNGVAFFQLLNGDGNFINRTALPVSSMQNVDVNLLDGRVAILSFTRIVRGALAVGPSVFVSPADCSDFQLVTTVGLTDMRLVRWVATWRHAAGENVSHVR